MINSVRHWLVRLPGILRRALGLFLLGLGILGAILPLLPGFPCLIGALFLLGQRDPAFRYPHLLGRRVLRWLRHSRNPLMHRLGVRLTKVYLPVRRLLFTPFTAPNRSLRRAVEH